MVGGVTLESGFAEVGAGAWLVGRAQPAACFGEAVRRRRKGWIVRDRARLDLVETTGTAKCAEAARPFLTHIPCAAPVSAVSDKVLVAPAAARRDAEILKLVPFSAKGAICVTRFALAEAGNGESAGAAPSPAWVVMATASRTARIPVPDGETLTVRPESLVAWTGNRPSGFCPKLGLSDLLLPRGPKNLLLRFHGPCIAWVEGAGKRAEMPANPFARRAV
jgi:hypothetical protein